MMGWAKKLGSSEVFDPQGRRLLGFTIIGNEPIWAPKGHSCTFAANGAGKTTSVSVPALMCWAASEPHKAVLVLDSKNGEIAIQMAAMLVKMGRKVAVIDDMDVWPQLKEYRVQLNAFGAAVATFKRDPQDLIFANENISNSLIPEPSGGDEKNKHFRVVPQELDEFAISAMLERDPDLATPGAVAAMLSDSEMFKGFAQIGVEEGSPSLKIQAQSVLDTATTENWGQHLSEARRSLRLFAPGNRLHEAGREATKTHADLIREGYIIFLAGPQAYMSRLGEYYALHIMAFTDALYHDAGSLRILADEFTNCPLKPLVSQITTLRAYGGELHAISQSRSEMVRKFGEHETQTIEENSITKQWLSFTSFEEATRVSKAMGEQNLVSESLGGDSNGLNTTTNLSLGKQAVMSPAELMAMPRDISLNHVVGVGFFLSRLPSQQSIAPYCNLIGANPLEGGKLTPDPKITLVTPEAPS